MNFIKLLYQIIRIICGVFCLLTVYPFLFVVFILYGPVFLSNEFNSVIFIFILLFTLAYVSTLLSLFLPVKLRGSIEYKIIAIPSLLLGIVFLAHTLFLKLDFINPAVDSIVFPPSPGEIQIFFLFNIGNLWFIKNCIRKISMNSYCLKHPSGTGY
jgi:hypothetical protein